MRCSYITNFMCHCHHFIWVYQSVRQQVQLKYLVNCNRASLVRNVNIFVFIHDKLAMPALQAACAIRLAIAAAHAST